MATVITLDASSLLTAIQSAQPTLPAPLNTDTVTVTPPDTVTATYNSRVVLAGTGAQTAGYKDVYTGSVSVVYGRLDLSVLFKGIYFRHDIRLTQDTTLWALLPALSEQWGMAFYPDDIQDVAIAATTQVQRLTFAASPTSFNFTGSTTLYLNSNRIPLTNAIANTALGGFERTQIVDW